MHDATQALTALDQERLGIALVVVGVALHRNATA
jgi:hypothetical protein